MLCSDLFATICLPRESKSFNFFGLSLACELQSHRWCLKLSSQKESLPRLNSDVVSPGSTCCCDHHFYYGTAMAPTSHPWLQRMAVGPTIVIFYLIFFLLMAKLMTFDLVVYVLFSIFWDRHKVINWFLNYEINFNIFEF